jgi:3-hydroxyisobutyrate dehydrogenase
VSSGRDEATGAGGEDRRGSAAVDGEHPRIGLIGLGRMGTPMAARLVAAGFPVTGFDLSPAARAGASHVGAEVVDTVEDAVRDADVVITVLPDSAAVEAVLRAVQVRGLLRPGATVVDMSSSEPDRTRVLAADLDADGIVLVDAPVSGGVKGAIAGTLTIMIGGADEVVERVRPVLSAMGTVRHAGPVGAGHAVKALNNLLSATHLLATSEAIATARRFGLEVETVLDIVNGSSGRSWSSEFKWPTFIVPETYDSGFSLRLMVKDVRIAVELMTANGAERTLAESTLGAWSRAAQALPEDADHTDIARWVEAARTAEEVTPAAPA